MKRRKQALEQGGPRWGRRQELRRVWVVFIITLMGRKLVYEYRRNMVISPSVALSVSLILVFILYLCKIHRFGLYIGFSP